MRRPSRSLVVKLVALAAVAGTGAATLPSALNRPATATSTSASTSVTQAVAAPAKRAPMTAKLVDIESGTATSTRPAQVPSRTTPRFSLLGLSWPAGQGATVSAQVRVRIAGRWTGWQALVVEDEHGPDGAEATKGRDGTEPLWVGSADGVQTKVTTGNGKPVRGVRLSLVDPGTAAADSPAALDATTTTTTTTTTSTNGTTVAPAPYARPGIVNRAGWGADESLRNYNPDCAVPSYGGTVKVAFVHHTAGTNTYTSSQSAGLVRGIYTFHVKSRGWCDIGYNFLVDKFGRIFEGRYGGILLPVLGAHTGGYNTDSFGVSLMGDFTSTEPSAAIMESTAKVIAWKLDGHYRNPKGTAVLAGKTLNVISGHRDTTATECPGARVYSKLPTLRSRVWTLMGGSVGTDIYNFAGKLGGFAKVGQPYYLEHTVAEGRGTWFTHRDIYSSAATGAHSVYGPVRTLHRGLGNANGTLGLPRTEEQNARVSGARVQEFRKAGVRRAVWWSSATGAHEVLDSIFAKYLAMSGETSKLGLPTSGQLGTHVAYGRVNLFQNGRIYYGRDSGTHPIIGAIDTRYKQSGVYSKLGLPTTDEFAVTGGLAQDFQHGRITWSSATGATTVTYR